jgi:hypothetical protein
MKKLILILLLAPVLLLSQPSFNVTDSNGNVWDSEEILEQGKTIIVQFFSPTVFSYGSSWSIEHLTEAYNNYGLCNDVFFLHVAEWGSEYEWATYLDNLIEGGYIDSLENVAPTIIGTEGGIELTYEWMEWGLQYSFELWMIRPDGSYEYTIPHSWNPELTVLADALEAEGFSSCETVGIEEFENKNKDKTTYDLMGRIINKPTEGFYIQDGKKYFIVK